MLGKIKFRENLDILVKPVYNVFCKGGKINLKVWKFVKTLMIPTIISNPIFKAIDTYFKGVPLEERILPLMKVIVIARGIEVKNGYEMFLATGKVEREIDDYYIKMYVSEVNHKEVCDFYYCVMALIIANEESPFSLQSLRDLLSKEFAPVEKLKRKKKSWFGAFVDPEFMDRGLVNDSYNL